MKRLKIILFFSSLALFTLGKWYGDHLRGEAISLFSPVWTKMVGLKMSMQPLSAMEGAEVGRIIYRTPSLWHTVFWIDLGERDVEMNSPVVVGNSVVGVIDYVGKRQSRVRLITDASLHLAVRVSRGEDPYKKVREDIDALLKDLEWFENDNVDRATSVAFLQNLKNYYNSSEGRHLLAKGELHGSSQPLWKKKGQLLTGIGFNLDFEDADSCARDLRTGMSPSQEEPCLPILQKHDLLITSGLDGVFPEGLLVAVVKDIQWLQEGDYYYNLIAEPTAGNLADLSSVTVLPALGFDPKDVPPTYGRRL